MLDFVWNAVFHGDQTLRLAACFLNGDLRCAIWEIDLSKLNQLLLCSLEPTRADIFNFQGNDSLIDFLK